MWLKSLNILQVALNCVAITAFSISVASLAGMVDTILFSLAYLSWREDKEEMIQIRREDKEEMAFNRREDKQKMAALRQNMNDSNFHIIS